MLTISYSHNLIRIKANKYHYFTFTYDRLFTPTGILYQAPPSPELAHQISQYPLEFSSPEAEEIYKLLLDEYNSSLKNKQILQEFFNEGKAPLVDSRLTPYQNAAAYAATIFPNYALFMDCGTGKTPVAIIAAKQAASVLVICPRTVQQKWQDEIQTWANESSIIARGSLAQRIVAALQKTKWLIFSYDAFAQTAKYLLHIEWDLVILDESHYIANSSTKRTKAILGIKAKRKLLLTGTPVRNDKKDLFTQFSFLSPYPISFKHFKPDLSAKSFIIKKDQALPYLPKKLFERIECEFSSEQEKAYNELARYLYTEITEQLTGEVTSLTINNILTKLLRLAQVTSGYMPTDDFNIHDFHPNDKLNTLLDIISTSDKTIVWCAFIRNIETITHYLNVPYVTLYGATQDKQKAIDTFNNDPNCRVLVGHPRTGGVGIDLLGFNPRVNCCDNWPLNPAASCHNCDRVVYFSSSWSYIDRAQSIDRVHRPQTRVPVRITELIIPNTIDTIISRRLQEKQRINFTVTDIRSVLEQIYGERAR